MVPLIVGNPHFSLVVIFAMQRLRTWNQARNRFSMFKTPFPEIEPQPTSTLVFSDACTTRGPCEVKWQPRALQLHLSLLDLLQLWILREPVVQYFASPLHSCQSACAQQPWCPHRCKWTEPLRSMSTSTRDACLCFQGICLEGEFVSIGMVVSGVASLPEVRLTPHEPTGVMSIQWLRRCWPNRAGQAWQLHCFAICTYTAS